MKILVTGSNGMLGTAVKTVIPEKKLISTTSLWPGQGQNRGPLENGHGDQIKRQSGLFHSA
jgi:hypothetical protein